MSSSKGGLCVQNGKLNEFMQCQRLHSFTQPSLLRTLVAQSYNCYGMVAQDVLIMKIPILRQFDWSLLKY